MYIPQYYKNENLKEVKNFLTNNSFGILINILDGKPWGTHIPLELDVDENGAEVLTGHIAKANPQSKNFQNNQDVLCIFNGPHSYVSSSWYKEEEVPTWNYIAVHIYGKLKVIEGEALMLHLKKLVDKYEGNSERAIKLENLSKKTLNQVRGIVGFQIEIQDIQASYKLSQTRPEDHEKIIHELEKTGDSQSLEIAQRMKAKKD